MNYGLYVAAAGLQHQEYRQDVIANNLANAQTVGFKRVLAQAQARVNPARESSQFVNSDALLRQAPAGGVWSMPTSLDLTQAPLTESANDHDLALQGPGFFMVQGNSPEERLLTRDGRFVVDNTGQLAMATGGHAVLDAEGNPIKLDPAKPFLVTTQGAIKQGEATVAQLAVMNVGKSTDLVNRGGNLLGVKEGSPMMPATVATQVRQGKTEQSGVDPMTEMVAMLEGQRHFEANTKMIQYQDTMLQQLNTVGRVA